MVLKMNLSELSGGSPFWASTRASPWTHRKGGVYTTPGLSAELDTPTPMVFGNCLLSLRISDTQVFVILTTDTFYLLASFAQVLWTKLLKKANKKNAY